MNFLKKEVKQMKLLRKVKSKASILKELFSFFWQNKLWWMIPIVLVFLLLGLLIFFTQSSALVPFIYTLF